MKALLKKQNKSADTKRTHRQENKEIQRLTLVAKKNNIFMGNLRGSEMRALARVLTGIGALSIFFILYKPSLVEGTMKISYEAIRNKPSNPIFKILPKYNGYSDRQRRNAVQTVSEPKESENVCNTTECFEAASTVLKNMDAGVDPCDNFYRFACGGFLNQTIIPDDKDSVTLFSIIEDKLEAQINATINAESESGERKPFRLVKNLYKSCMNQAAIEAKGLEPVHARLKEFGGWPVLDGDSWSYTDANWEGFLYKVIETDNIFDYFIDFNVYVDLKNSTKRNIYLDQPQLDLAYEYLTQGFDDKIISAYYSYMVDIAVILGAQRDHAMEELKESLSFAMKLAKISLPQEERRNITQLYNPMTVAELRKNYPTIPWKEYFSRLLPSSITIEENEVVIVFAPNYIRDLETLLSETPNRVQANYAIWRIVSKSVSYLNEDVRKKEDAFSTVSSGITKRAPRWKECVQLVSNKFSIVVSAMYVRQYFNEDAKKNAVAMVTNIKEQFNKTLTMVDWMDEKTRKKALEKAAAMSSYIAYPEELLDDDKLEKIYGNLELSEDSYYNNILNTAAFERNDGFSKLREPYDQTDWKEHATSAVVNAFYNAVDNSIEIPAGILQDLFFNNNRPKYMNYAGIGFVVGHEMTHGFDDLGRQFDSNGNIVDWWEPLTKENYLNRTSCIIDQYANYTVEEVHLKLNGIKTQGENIADIGGMKAAYIAYNDWVEKNGPEQKLPGIDKTPQQMFWISAANAWCSMPRPEALKLWITQASHTPAEFRILGSMSNMLEFAKDFNCSVGSNMNPKKKCSVW